MTSRIRFRPLPRDAEHTLRKVRPDPLPIGRILHHRGRDFAESHQDGIVHFLSPGGLVTSTLLIYGREPDRQGIIPKIVRLL